MLQTYIDQKLSMILYWKEVLNCGGERLALFLDSPVKDWNCSPLIPTLFHLFFQ